MTVAFTDNGFNLFNWGAFKGMLGSLLLTLVQFLCTGVYFMETSFWVLARGVKMKDGSYRNIIDGLLFNGTSVADNNLTKIVGIIVLIAVALTIIACVVAVIKANFSTRDEDRNPKVAVIGVVKAIVLMIAFPVIIYIVLLITNTLTNAICQYAKFDATDKNSLANQLFFMFMNPAGRKNCLDPTGLARFSFTLTDLKDCGFSGGNAWQQLISAGFINGNKADGLFGYSYILAMVVTIVLIYALFKAIILLVRRIFDISVLYVVAPLPIACYPNDEGKRFEIWKDLIASKILSAFGLALTFIVYSILVNTISDTFEAWCLELGGEFRSLNVSIVNGELNASSVLSVIYIFVMLSGALAIPNMYTLLSSLIGVHAGMAAGQDMQNLSNDMAYFQRGRATAMRAGGLALGATVGLLKGGLFGKKGLTGGNQAANNPNNNSGKVGTALKAFAAGGLIGGTAGLISKGYNSRLDKKAEGIRDYAIKNYDDKAKVREANAQLKKMHRDEVTARDVIEKEKDKQNEAKAIRIAKRNKGK